MNYQHMTNEELESLFNEAMLDQDEFIAERVSNEIFNRKL